MFCLKESVLKNCIARIKDYTYYCVCERYPVTEYVVGITDSLGDTKAIMDKCSWTFSPFEVAKLFLNLYANKVISIALTAILWFLFGEQIATELVVDLSTPSWMLPICLFGASETFSRILGEVLLKNQ